MSDFPNSVLTDTSDMPALHAVFRNSFAAAPGLIGGTAADDTDRSAIVGTYYDCPSPDVPAFVKVGDTVTVTTDSYPDIFHGKIAFDATAVDPTTASTKS